MHVLVVPRSGAVLATTGASLLLPFWCALNREVTGSGRALRPGQA